VVETANAPLDEPSGLGSIEGSDFGEVVFLTIKAFSEQGVDPLALILLGGYFRPNINSVTDAKEQKEKGFSQLLQSPELPFYLVQLDLTVGIKWEVSDEIQNALDRINSTISGIGEELTERLHHWYRLLSRLPSEDPKLILRLINGLRRLSKDEQPESEREMIAFLRECESNLNTAAMIVSDGLVRGSKESFSIFSLIPDAVIAGGSAYLEALNIISMPVIFEPKNELRPPDFARAILFYFIARRLGNKDLIAEALVDMVHGAARCGKGPIYNLAWCRYENLPDIERELVADAYCEGFIEALERMPHEALLCPALAVRWAMRRADWKAKKVLPDDLPLQLLPNDGFDINHEEHTETVADLFIQYEQLPDYELALRHYGNDIPLSQLASELGISKPAVYKRIQKFLDKARKLYPSNIF
jgi:hypothetical protein